MKKIIILILTVCFLSLTVGYFAQAERFTRAIGANKTSFCDCELQGDDFVCNCACQQSNPVKDCHVGWLISDPICACCGDCTLNNFIGLAINVADKLLQLLGVFALLFVVVGGIIWITSGGSAENVEKGKNIIKGAIIGLVIVLIAFTIVRIAMKALGTEGYLPVTETEEKITE